MFANSFSVLSIRCVAPAPQCAVVPCDSMRSCFFSSNQNVQTFAVDGT